MPAAFLAILFLAACAPISITINIGNSTPTATAAAIVQPQPTNPPAIQPATAAPKNAPPAPTQSSSNSRCITYVDAPAQIGNTTCVRGIVSSATKDAGSSAFFINFDSSRTSFYAVSFRHTWENLRGKCVEITGKIIDFRGRAEIVIEDKEQLKECQ
ncbi:MAG: hypothetical protein HY327_12690 [Chloroflexi bacterium]|nr:hypothetical protein [Chloroflexota bacterium]